MKKFCKKIFVIMMIVVILVSGGEKRVFAAPATAQIGEKIQVPSASEYPQAIDVECNYSVINWGYSCRTMYEKWKAAGSQSDPDVGGIACIKIKNVNYLIVAVAPTFGTVGDYLKVHVNHDGEEKDYYMIVGDTKNPSDSTAFYINGIHYGHRDGSYLKVLEFIYGDDVNWRSSDSSEKRRLFLNVEYIINGGSYFENESGPTGFSVTGEEADTEDETSTFIGMIGYLARHLIGILNVLLCNLYTEREDPNVMYSMGSDDDDDSSRKSTGGDWVQYYQGDYSDVPYGDGNIANSGCGVTSFAMVATKILGQEVTPKEVAEWAGNRYYVAGAGTSWNFYAAAAEHYNLGCSVTQTSSFDEAYSALQAGKIVICNQRVGLFTSGGTHIIVLAELYSDGTIRVLDPVKSHAIDRNYNERHFEKSEISSTSNGAYWIFNI